MLSTTVRLPVQSWSSSMEMVRCFWDKTGFLTFERSCIRLIRGTTASWKTAQHAFLFEQGLGKIVETTAKLYLKKEARPKYCWARQVPYVLYVKKIEREIDRQMGEGILEPVMFSRWVTPGVPILKKDGSIVFAEITRSLLTKPQKPKVTCYPELRTFSPHYLEEQRFPNSTWRTHNSKLCWTRSPGRSSPSIRTRVCTR